jgi:hypothetical protein
MSLAKISTSPGKMAALTFPIVLLMQRCVPVYEWNWTALTITSVVREFKLHVDVGCMPACVKNV